MAVALVVHPGKVGDIQRARTIVDQAASAVGVDPPTWYETTEQDPGPGQARRAIGEGATTVIAWGGDGTVLGVAGVVRGTDVGLGIVPGGTGNLLARNLDIPLDPAAALRVALGGSERRIDLLDVYLGGGRHEVSAVMCGMGIDADMVDAPEGLKKRVGWGAYVVQGSRHLGHPPMRLRISVDDGPVMHLHGQTVVVANVGSLVAGVNLIPEAEFDDGLLDVLIMDPTKPREWIRTGIGILRGRGADADPARTHLRGRRVVVSTNQPRNRQIDGEIVGKGHGFRVNVDERCLLVRVPGESVAATQ